MAEDPIIVRGGGSFTLEFSDKLKDNGSSGGNKKYKNANGTLRSIQINTETPRTLNPGDTVTIITDDGSSGPGQQP